MQTEHTDPNNDEPTRDQTVDHEETPPPPPPPQTLHRVGGIVWAAMFGTLFAGAVLMAINYTRLGRKAAAKVAVVIGLLLTGCVVAGAISLPVNSNATFVVPQLLFALFVTNKFQGQILAEHIEAGGKVASMWKGVGLGVLILPVVLALSIPLALVLPSPYGWLLDYKGDEVYYQRDATEADARRFAEVLEEQQWLSGQGVSVQIHISKRGTRVRLIVVEAFRNSTANDPYYRRIAKALLDAGFPGPVTITPAGENFRGDRMIRVVE